MKVKHILAAIACILLTGGVAWVAFRPAVADRFGYALPFSDRLPARISYDGRRYQDTWPCGGAACARAIGPACLSRRTLRRRYGWPLRQVSSIPTLLGPAHPVLRVTGPDAAALLYVPIHGCYVVYSLVGGP